MILLFQTLLLIFISFQDLNEYIYYIDDSQLIKRDIISEEIEVIDFNNPDMINLNDYELMVKESGIFFISNDSGIVYKIKDDFLTRIDKSLDN